MTVNEALSYNLKRILKERHMSQVEFSRLSGISKHTVNGYFTGKHGASVAVAFVAAKTLNVTIDDLVRGADEW